MDASVRPFKIRKGPKIALRVKESRRSFLCFLSLLLAIGWAQTVRAEFGDRTRLGKAGEWKDTIGVATLDSRLYTIEINGALYATDLSSGRWLQIGKAEFADTQFLFADGPSLYTIETNGALYRINPRDGSWRSVGETGAWKGTIAGTTLNGRIYTVEENGALFETNPANGSWKQLGKPEFARTRHMCASNGSLYTIEDGGLYRVSSTDGSWGLVGKAEDWSGTRAVAVLAGTLFSANSNGALYRSMLATGGWVAVGKPVFGGTVYMFESGHRLYSIDGDGSLYLIDTTRLTS